MTEERPILFSGPMVRALLDGSKTQTRRLVKPQPIPDAQFAGGWKVAGKGGEESATGSPLVANHSPYGQPGDRLWVRETWQIAWGNTGYWYAATDSHADDGNSPVSRWRPSIHMHRAASRITLEITSVRVERLQDISEADAQAEGITPYQNHPGRWLSAHRPGLNYPSAIAAYRDLWEGINGPGNWDTNPWVWVLEFRRLP